MAQSFTTEQALKAAQDSGLYNKFSQADLNLAQTNPDAFMTILQAKKDYAAATTPEAKALANQKAEAARSSYGGYTGGGDGSKFYANPLSPGSFTADTAPTYENPYAGTMQNLLDQQLNYGSYSFSGEKPTYTNQYADTIADLFNQQKNFEDYSYSGEKPTYTDQYAGLIANLYDRQRNYADYSYAQPQPEWNSRYDEQKQQLLDQALNMPEFSYDPNTDPMAAAYRKEYAREGQRAEANALAEAAAATGGIPSSYAITASQQAGNYYASQMADKIPELYQLAYAMYRDKYNQALNNLNAVQAMEDSDYMKYTGDLNQYNANRAFDYSTYLDKYSRLANDLQFAQSLEQMDYEKFLNELGQYNADRTFDYAAYADRYNRLSNNLQTANMLEQTDYAKYLNDVSQYNTDRSFDYNAWLDQYNMIANNLQTTSGLEQQEFNKYLAALDQYNIDRSFGYQQLLDEVNNQAGLRAEDRQAQLDALNRAIAAAEYNDYAPLREQGINTAMQEALLRAQYGDYSGMQAMGLMQDVGTVSGPEKPAGNPKPKAISSYNNLSAEAKRVAEAIERMNKNNVITQPQAEEMIKRHDGHDITSEEADYLRKWINGEATE